MRTALATEVCLIAAKYRLQCVASRTPSAITPAGGGRSSSRRLVITRMAATEAAARKTRKKTIVIAGSSISRTMIPMKPQPSAHAAMSVDPRACRCTRSTVRNVRLAALSMLAALVLAAPAYGAVSFTDVEDEVMCTVCGTPLNLAPGDAPFAQRERAYIRRLIARGDSKQEIKDALARQYGDEVLALPKND